VLIAGLPNLTLTLPALRQILAAWVSTDTPQTGALGSVVDTETDLLTGGPGADWFVRSPTDSITDLGAGDVVT